MMFEQFCFVLLAFVFTVKGQLAKIPDSPKVNMSIYYESLCPDSVNFITQALSSTYEYMEPYINLRFIPFGKSQVQENNKYVCQHGPRECIRNIIQACALNQIHDQDVQVNFVVCVMENEAIENYETCSVNNGVSWEKVERCSNGPLGRKLILRAQEETRRMTDGPKFVPTIVYNNLFIFNDTLESLKNPLIVVCKYIEVSAPFCKQAQQYLFQN